jgi:hypothetical protein
MHLSSFPAGKFRRPVVWLFFGVLLVLGGRLVGDYGTFGDEYAERNTGHINLAYLYEFVPLSWLPARAAVHLTSTPESIRLPNFHDRDYGVAFALPVVMLEKIEVDMDMGDILLLRHWCVFLVCFAGLLAFYWLATLQLGSWRLGLLGSVALILSPRQFADAFYNCKDAVFLACFLIATATAVAFIKRPSLASAAWHALACAIAIDVRIMAVLLPVLTGGLLLLRTLRGDYEARRVVLPSLLYASLLCILAVVMWPYLWENPLVNFGQAFLNMSHFRWTGAILHQGHIIPPGAPLPWNYAPIWIGITVPLVYLVGLLLSFGLLIRQLVRRRWQLFLTDSEWQYLFFWVLAVGPLVAVSVLHSVLYDGWRQLYFVYPSLLILALRGLLAAWQWQLPWPELQASWQGMVSVSITVSLVLIAGQMMRLHPFENLYFNALAGSHPELRYEYDYWSLSFRQGLEWIVQHDTRPKIRVRARDGMNLFMLPPAQRARLVIVSETEPADYFMTTYRFHPQSYGLGSPIYSLRIEDEGRRVFDIFRLH